MSCAFFSSKTAYFQRIVQIIMKFVDDSLWSDNNWSQTRLRDVRRAVPVLRLIVEQHSRFTSLQAYLHLKRFVACFAVARNDSREFQLIYELSQYVATD